MGFRTFRLMPVVAMLLWATAGHAAVTVQEIRGASGVSGLLVEDYSVPVVSIHFAFRGGGAHDPDDRAGLANLLTWMLDEGAGTLNADAFQQRLDDSGAELSFSSSDDAIFGSMRMLADNRGEALDLLRLAVREPRFDDEALKRIREQIVAGLTERERDPDRIGEIAWLKAIFAGHPYARRDEGTARTVAAIGADDLRSFHRRAFARSNLVVGVVGAVDAADAALALDLVFGALPPEASLGEVAWVEPKLGQRIDIPSISPQATIHLAYPMLPKQDPDVMVSHILNELLGGAPFTSKLFIEVREKQGLAYEATSTLSDLDHSSIMFLMTSTRADRRDRTIEAVRKVVRSLATDGPTQAELDAIKRYVKSGYAVSNLESSGLIADALVHIQRERLGSDYFSRREALIDAVTLDDVKALAARYLTADPTIMVVGPQPKGDQ